MAAESRDQWRHQKNCGPFYPEMPVKIFILIGCSVLHMQSRCHNEGNYDVIKITLIPHEEYLLCAKFQFFPFCGFRETEGQSFSVFPIWLPHHVTYDVILIIKTCYMSIRTNGEKFVSISQAVAQKNTKVLCKQTNRQSNKQTNPNVITSPNPSVRVTMEEMAIKEHIHLWVIVSLASGYKVCQIYKNNKSCWRTT